MDAHRQNDVHEILIFPILKRNAAKKYDCEISLLLVYMFVCHPISTYGPVGRLSRNLGVMLPEGTPASSAVTTSLGKGDTSAMDQHFLKFSLVLVCTSAQFCLKKLACSVYYSTNS
jgi:hypothetical protein